MSFLVMMAIFIHICHSYVSLMEGKQQKIKRKQQYWVDLEVWEGELPTIRRSSPEWQFENGISWRTWRYSAKILQRFQHSRYLKMMIFRKKLKFVSSKDHGHPKKIKPSILLGSLGSSSGFTKLSSASEIGLLWWLRVFPSILTPTWGWVKIYEITIGKGEIKSHSPALLRYHLGARCWLICRWSTTRIHRQPDVGPPKSMIHVVTRSNLQFSCLDPVVFPMVSRCFTAQTTFERGAPARAPAARSPPPRAARGRHFDHFEGSGWWPVCHRPGNGGTDVSIW